MNCTGKVACGGADRRDRELRCSGLSHDGVPVGSAKIGATETVGVISRRAAVKESQGTGREWVKQLDLGITWDPNASYPCLIQTDNRGFLVLNLFEDTHFDGDKTSVNAQPVGVIEWKELYTSLMGPQTTRRFRAIGSGIVA
jgi:hypothetical protein